MSVQEMESFSTKLTKFVNSLNASELTLFLHLMRGARRAAVAEVSGYDDWLTPLRHLLDALTHAPATHDWAGMQAQELLYEESMLEEGS